MSPLLAEEWEFVQCFVMEFLACDTEVLIRALTHGENAIIYLDFRHFPSDYHIESPKELTPDEHTLWKNTIKRADEDDVYVAIYLASALKYYHLGLLYNCKTRSIGRRVAN